MIFLTFPVRIATLLTALLRHPTSLCGLLGTYFISQMPPLQFFKMMAAIQMSWIRVSPTLWGGGGSIQRWYWWTHHFDHLVQSTLPSDSSYTYTYLIDIKLCAPSSPLSYAYFSGEQGEHRCCILDLVWSVALAFLACGDNLAGAIGGILRWPSSLWTPVMKGRLTNGCVCLREGSSISGRLTCSTRIFLHFRFYPSLFSPLTSRKWYRMWLVGSSHSVTRGSRRMILGYALIAHFEINYLFFPF